MASSTPAKPQHQHSHHHNHHHHHHNANNSPNYISLSLKRAKEISAPACSTLSNLQPAHRRIALAVVLVVFFWPLVLLALNLPWMITAGAAIYAFVFGVGKLASDAKEAAKEHLDVDVDEKTRAAKRRFQESQFRGKDELVTMAGKAQEWFIFIYKASLLVVMKVIDYFVTLLLHISRFIKGVSVRNDASSTSTATTATAAAESNADKDSQAKSEKDE